MIPRGCPLGVARCVAGPDEDGDHQEVWYLLTSVLYYPLLSLVLSPSIPSQLSVFYMHV